MSPPAPPSGPLAQPTRRRVLIAGLIAATGSVLTGCIGQSAAEAEDPLLPLYVRATADARLAEATGVVHPPLGAAMAAVVTDRLQHAEALRGEVARLRPETLEETTTESTTTPSPPPITTVYAEARRNVLDALRAAEEEAGDLLPMVHGYRAGLIASIAACCASHQAVMP